MTDTAMLTEVSEPAARRDTSAGWRASAEARARSAAERYAVEKFAPSVALLSDKTVHDLAELLIATCEARGIPVLDLLGEDEQL